MKISFKNKKSDIIKWRLIDNLYSYLTYLFLSLMVIGVLGLNIIDNRLGQVLSIYLLMIGILYFIINILNIIKIIKLKEDIIQYSYELGEEQVYVITPKGSFNLLYNDLSKITETKNFSKIHLSVLRTKLIFKMYVPKQGCIKEERELFLSKLKYKVNEKKKQRKKSKKLKTNSIDEEQIKTDIIDKLKKYEGLSLLYKINKKSTLKQEVKRFYSSYRMIMAVIILFFSLMLINITKESYFLIVVAIFLFFRPFINYVIEKRKESCGIVLIDEESNIILKYGLYEIKGKCEDFCIGVDKCNNLIIKNKEIKGVEYYIESQNIIDGNCDFLFKKLDRFEVETINIITISGFVLSIISVLLIGIIPISTQYDKGNVVLLLFFICYILSFIFNIIILIQKNTYKKISIKSIGLNIMETLFILTCLGSLLS